MKTTRPGEKKEWWAKRKVQDVLEAPGVLIQTNKQKRKKASVQHLGVVTFIMWSRGLGIICVGGRRGRCTQREEDKSLLEAVHQLGYVIEREHRCVCTSDLLLTGLGTEEVVLRAWLVCDVRRRAVKLRDFDRDRRDHGDIKVLVEHWRAPVDPQVWRCRPRIWLVLERKRKLRRRVKHRERRLRLPSVHTNVQRLECGRRIWGNVRRGRTGRACVRGSRRRLEEPVRIGRTARDSEWVEVR